MLIIMSEEDVPCRCTLLDLVQAITDGTASDQECVAVINALLSSGRVVLTGNFRGQLLN